MLHIFFVFLNFAIELCTQSTQSIFPMVPSFHECAKGGNFEKFVECCPLAMRNFLWVPRFGEPKGDNIKNWFWHTVHFLRKMFSGFPVLANAKPRSFLYTVPYQKIYIQFVGVVGGTGEKKGAHKIEASIF